MLRQAQHIAVRIGAQRLRVERASSSRDPVCKFWSGCVCWRLLADLGRPGVSCFGSALSPSRPLRDGVAALCLGSRVFMPAPA